MASLLSESLCGPQIALRGDFSVPGVMNLSLREAFIFTLPIVRYEINFNPASLSISSTTRGAAWPSHNGGLTDVDQLPLRATSDC